MKFLNKLSSQLGEVLTRNELKQVQGGLSTYCETTCSCPEGTVVKPGGDCKISVECDGNCSKHAGVYVRCNNQTTYCDHYDLIVRCCVAEG